MHSLLTETWLILKKNLRTADPGYIPDTSWIFRYLDSISKILLILSPEFVISIVFSKSKLVHLICMISFSFINVFHFGYTFKKWTNCESA